jgi:hypothetical protein
MYILSILSQGFGNKLFMLFNLLDIFKRIKKNGFNKIYIVIQKSHHDSGDVVSQINHIFPNLKDSELIQIISWKEYDKLKHIPSFNDYPPDSISESFQIISTYKFKNININSIKPFFKTSLKLSRDLPKYDYKNGIFIHARYGDKLIYNSKPNPELKFELLYPKFYIDMITSYEGWENRPIYVFTDSPEVVNRCFPMERIQLCEDPWWNVFLIFTKAKRIIFADSTITIGAAIMNTDYDGRYFSSFGDNGFGGYVGSNSKIISDKKYLIKTGADTIKFKKHCS